MSNCANIINLLTREICLLKDRVKSVNSMLNVLEINQAIFERTDLTVYLIPADSSTETYCAVPAKIKRTEDGKTHTYDGLVSLVEAKDCIVYSTRDLHKDGKRSNTGFFKFTDCISVHVECVDTEILKKVTTQMVYDALKFCSTNSCDRTLTCSAYNALLAFLRSFGISSLDYTQAACIYRYFKKVLDGDSCDNESHHEEVGPAEPNEPAAPYELQDFVVNVADNDIFVGRTNADSTVSESSGSNTEAIEMKLRALLEHTEETSDNF